MTAEAALAPNKLRPADLARVASLGLRTRRLRAALSALGIAIGVAAIVAVLDPRDKYVQVYVPVADVARFRVGRRVEIELDSTPGRLVPGEVSFVADHASFTPEKIEPRSDRMGQVYRAKVRILEDVEHFQPGTEGNVYLAG